MTPPRERVSARYSLPLAGVPDDAVGFRAGLAAFIVERFGDVTMALVEAVTEQKEVDGRPAPGSTASAKRLRTSSTLELGSSR